MGDVEGRGRGGEGEEEEMKISVVRSFGHSFIQAFV